MKMDDDKLLDILRRKEDAAGAYVWGSLGDARENAMREYHRMPYGNEEDGWSSIVASDVQDTVEWILPALLKIFTSTDKAVSFEPTRREDVKGAEQATDACNYVFYKQNNGFLVLYTAIKDALLLRNCAVMWRKEDQEVVSTVPFKDASAEMLAMLQSEKEAEIIEANEAPIVDQQTGQPAIDEFGKPIMGYSGRLKHVETKTIVKVEAFSPEDLLIDREWTTPLLADCPYVARQMRVTLSDLKMMGFKDVTSEDLRGSNAIDARVSAEDVDRQDSVDIEDNSEEGALAEGWLRIEFVLVDADGDGIAERLCVYRLDNKILKREVVSHVPFATFSPMLNSHRWDGLSMHDAVTDLQRLHTELLRQTLNNLYLSNNPRTKVLTDSMGTPKANLDDLLDSRPGGIIRQQTVDAITEHVVPFAAAGTMPMLEYVQGMRENRTGVSRTSQGLNPDSLNNTATGRQIDMAAAQQKTELIARVIAEVLMKPIFLGILKLVTDGSMDKMLFRLRDEYVEYDPNEWRDQYDMTVNVGLGTGDKQAQMGALQMIMQNQMALMPMGLADPAKIYHTQSKIVEAAGFKDVQNFLNDPANTPPQPPPPNPLLQVEQMKQQGMAQKAQFDAQQEQQRMMMQDQQHQREVQRDMELERNKQEMQARDNQHTAQLDAQKAQYEAKLAQDRHNAELNHALTLEQMRLNNAREIAELNNATRLQVAQISAHQAVTLADIAAQQAAANDLTKDMTGDGLDD